VAHAPTGRPSPRAPRWPLLLASGALLLAGCGLKDYEEKMSAEAARVRSWDEETKVLGEPIKMPELPKKDGKEQTWNVFLRLPRGVSEAPVVQQNSTLAQLYGDRLAQYPGGSNSVGIQNVFVGVSDQKDYASAVLGQFGFAPGGETAVVVPRSPVLVSGTGKSLGTEITVKRKLVEGQSLYSFNFYEHGAAQVAVVFQMQKDNGQRADAAIRSSLATLGAEDEVYPLRAVYDKTNRKPRK
jgi:hypothetical protein